MPTYIPYTRHSCLLACLRLVSCTYHITAFHFFAYCVDLPTLIFNSVKALLYHFPLSPGCRLFIRCAVLVVNQTCDRVCERATIVNATNVTDRNAQVTTHGLVISPIHANRWRAPPTSCLCSKLSVGTPL